MRKLSLLFLALIFISTAYGQKTEFSAHLNSGLFSFGGESATKSSIIIANDAGSNYTINPYGTQKTFSYGLSVQLQRITTYKLLFGLQAGYELLRSNVTIDDVAGEFINNPTSATGQTTFRNGFITVYPSIGRRFIFSDLNIDLTIGPELGFNVISKEKGEATTNNDILIKTDHEINSGNTDFRLRSSLTVYYKHWGISTSYSHGLRNYSSDLIGGNRERFSRFFRIGITYRI